MANITKVYLMNCLLEKDYAHTLYFESQAAQQAYFQQRIKSALTFTDFSYQRKDNIIRIPAHVDQLFSAKVNYCMYQNAQYSNKWFYAFVTDMQYVNDGCTEVHIQTDCIQTWMFDYTVKHSFVEREHATTDTVGAHTIEEGLELGDYVCESCTADGNLTSLKYILQVTEPVPPSDGNTVYATNYGGIPHAGGAYICNTFSEVASIVNAYSGGGKADAVIAAYMIPAKIINDSSGDMLYSGQTTPGRYDTTVTKPTTVNGYTPRNKKLLSFPFVYLSVSNNSGVANVYRYEFFSSSDCGFHVEGIPVIGGSIKNCPKYYKGVAVNQEEGIMCGKFPTLSWSADLYTNWLTQNSVNIAMGIGAGALQVVGGVATVAATAGTGASIGGAGIVGGVQSIASTLAQIHQQSFTPNSARGNTNGGDINTALGVNTFHYYKMTIRAEIARVIDEYFDMFGYKCNRVKVPAKNHRQSYWYTKTIDANIIGGIPQDDLQTIKDCYNRGITFWKTEEYYRNYSAPNAIV